MSSYSWYTIVAILLVIVIIFGFFTFLGNVEYLEYASMFDSIYGYKSDLLSQKGDMSFWGAVATVAGINALIIVTVLRFALNAEMQREQIYKELKKANEALKSTLKDD